MMFQLTVLLGISFISWKAKKQKQKVPELQKDLLPLLLIWVIHFVHVNAIAFVLLPQRHHGKSE